jgi:ribosomal-protein-alanine N-acetyltransferase
VERLVSDGDLNHVVAIERASFNNPWTWDMFKWEMENAPVSRVYVLRCPERGILAFCAVWLVGDELHINNLAVHPAHRRQGLGQALLDGVLEETVRQGGRHATLEVRRSNLEAVRLYERMGFEVAGVRHNYYTNPEEDALILWKSGLGGAACEAPGAQLSSDRF